MGNYTTVARIYDEVPMVGSVDDLTSAQIVSGFISPAEGEINARLSRRYTVPITGSTPILEGIADDLATYRILSRRVFTQDQLKDSVWPLRFKEAQDLLKEIADGTIELVDSGGAVIAQRTDIAQAATNNMNYNPTFHEGGSWLDQIKDPDKVDDLLDERDL